MKKLSRKSLVEISALVGQFVTLEQSSREHLVNGIECQIITRDTFKNWADGLVVIINRET